MVQSATRPTRAAPGPGKTLGKELADFLIEFSIGVHRYSMYPSDHPSLGPAAGNVMARLTRLLEERPDLSLGVAHRQLVIDGLATEQKHPVLSDLANRLHDNHIGAITFTMELRRESLEGLFEALAATAEDDDDAIGLRPAAEIPSWPGLKIFPVGYEDLTLDQDGVPTTDGQVLQLWLGLARAAVAGTSGESDLADETELDPSQIADKLRGHKERAYDEVIVSYLLQIADKLADGDPASQPLRDKISELVGALDRPTLERILRMGGDAQRRRQIVRHAFEGVGGTAALKILETAAATTGQEISVLMVRMLTKLSFHADLRAGERSPQAASVVSDTIDELMDGWGLEDPNPEGYVRILDELSRATPYLTPTGTGLAAKNSSLSLIQMSIEIDAYGDMIDQALDELLSKGGLTLIPGLLEGAMTTETGRRVRDRVGSPHQIEALAEFEQVSDESIEVLVQLIGSEQAVEPLLRLLAESESRSLRRTVFDRLVQMSEHVGQSITPFLEDPRWYVVRNMLELVAALPERPSGFNTMRYATHPDLRVRRAALPLAVTDPVTRAKALTTALRETDERMVRTGLLELRNQLPPALTPMVVNRCLKNDEMSASLRLLALSVLESTYDPMVRDAVLSIASQGRSLFGKQRLASIAGPEGELTKAALALLVAGWSDDPQVTPLIKAARKVRDPEVQRILDGKTGAAGAALVQGLWEGKS